MAEEQSDEESGYSIIWAPQIGPQTALISCPIFEVFFGGARGGGKTDGMLGDFIRHASLFGEHAIGLMIRRELTQLIEAIERSKQIYLPLGWQYNEQQKMWRTPNGARLRFAYLERDSDADAYQGHSYTRIYVEELGTFPSSVPILKLMATLRSGNGIPCGFRATGNPGGPGHQWVRERYIDPCREGMKIISQNFENPWTKKIITRERIFIPSQLTHNKYLGEDYVANLQMSGSANLVRAWLEGDWNIVDGAFFDCWSNAKHIVRPFEVPADWTRFRAADWGSAKPFSVGWYAIVGDDYQIEGGQKLPRGCLVQYREWYGCKLKDGGGFEPNVGLKLTAEEVANGIKLREGDDKIAYGVIDPAAFASDGGPSIAERMLRQGITWRPADNKRVSNNGAMGGWDQMRARLKGDEDGNPMLVFMTNCAHAIRTIPAMQHDSSRPEDMDSDGEDHAPDQTRYAVMSRPWIRTITVETPTRPTDKYSRFKEADSWRTA